jgi:hypothetical protein
VNDIKVHERENDLILATHGRSIAILDDARAVQQMNPGIEGQDVYLFEPRPAFRFTTRFTRYGVGGAVYKGSNPPYGALITYYLKEKVDEKAPFKIEILDAQGNLVRNLTKFSREAGVQRAAWDLKGEPPVIRKVREDADEELGGRGPRGPEVLPGVYTVRLTAAGKSVEAKVTVGVDPMVTVSEADLRLRHETAKKLFEMVNAGNKTLKTFDSLGQQLEQIEKLATGEMGEKGKPVLKAVEGYKKELAEISGTLARPADASRLESGARIVEKMNDLFGSVEGANARPTQAMLDTISELEPLYRERMAAASRFLTTTLPQWNDTLRKLGAAGLVAGQ